jgi:hypothetical protein
VGGGEQQLRAASRGDLRQRLDIAMRPHKCTPMTPLERGVIICSTRAGSKV